MKQEEFIEELVKLGFKYYADETLPMDLWFGMLDHKYSAYKKGDILVEMYGGIIDNYEDILVPYTLTINKKRIIGHKRALKILRGE